MDLPLNPPMKLAVLPMSVPEPGASYTAVMQEDIDTHQEQNNIRSRRGARWTAEEDRILREIHAEEKWLPADKCTDRLPGRSRGACVSRLQRLQGTRGALVRWNAHEDDCLRRVYKSLKDPKKLSWTAIAHRLQKKTGIPRIGKQCRERWYQYVAPNLSHNPWTNKQRALVYSLGNQSKKGDPRRWARIAALPELRGKSPDNIKNMFNSKHRLIPGTD